MKTKRAALAACVLAALASLFLGAADLSPAQLFSGTGTAAGRIFLYVRLPRTAG